jgi:hypothetical protein
MQCIGALLYLATLLLFSPIVQSKFQKEERLRISTDPHFNHTIVIGAPISFDINDVHFTSGTKMKNGWTMFTEWVNNKGGIKLHGENVSITLVCIEDYSDPHYIEEAIHFLQTASDHPADFFLAPYSRQVYSFVLYYFPLKTNQPTPPCTCVCMMSYRHQCTNATHIYTHTHKTAQDNNIILFFPVYNSSLTKDASDLIDPAGKILMASAASNEQVFASKNYTFGTTGPSLLYIEAAFRCLTTFQAKRVAVIRDKNEPMCFLDTVTAVSAESPVELYGYYDLDNTASDYEDQIYAILMDLNANGVESVMGCSYLDLCIHVSGLILLQPSQRSYAS